ncbi:hypothetical protein DH09_18910 [Bacillaceae bacterium JMAK1]|nr:hypothetical protein DH09_18910 [Bacillaceae bacterium JMAK1]
MKSVLQLTLAIALILSPVMFSTDLVYAEANDAELTEHPSVTLGDIQLAISRLERQGLFTDRRLASDLQRELTVMRFFLKDPTEEKLHSYMLEFQQSLAEYRDQNRLNETSYEQLRTLTNYFLHRHDTLYFSYDSDWADRLDTTQLHYTLPEESNLNDDELKKVQDVMTTGLQDKLYPGAVTLIAKDGDIVFHDSIGDSYKYDAIGEPLSSEDTIAMTNDMLFDLASLTKTFTATAIMQLHETNRLSIDDEVINYLPEFSTHPDKDTITIEQLLTHTSGLPASISLATYEEQGKMWEAILSLETVYTPGTQMVYSDVGMMILGRIVEVVSEQSFDTYVEESITTPLGMTDTMFNPDRELHTIAPTEYSPDRGLVWGDVHDEKAAALNGIAGHAGLFSTAYDLAIFLQTMINGGSYGDAQVLQPESVQLMMEDQIITESHLGQSLGWNVNRGWFMAGLSSPSTVGHTGFTGTSFVLDPLTDSFVIFLTNRVHPTRDEGSINGVRHDLVQQFIRSIPYSHPFGGDTWYSGMSSNTSSELVFEFDTHMTDRLVFNTSFDILNDIARDQGFVEFSTDDGNTWEPLPVTIAINHYTKTMHHTWIGSTKNHWVEAEASIEHLTEEEVLIRFRYLTSSSNGKGWWIRPSDQENWNLVDNQNWSLLETESEVSVH